MLSKIHTTCTLQLYADLTAFKYSVGVRMNCTRMPHRIQYKLKRTSVTGRDGKNHTFSK
jgi:hypothetical protein